MKFSELSLDPGLMEGIEATGYVTLTPIQEQVMPTILAGRDIIASAQTGTGKTAAFLLPILSKLIEHRHEGHTNGIIIVPTRELAVQIAQAVEGMAYFTPISSIAIYGGGDGNARRLPSQGPLPADDAGGVAQAWVALSELRQ